MLVSQALKAVILIPAAFAFLWYFTELDISIWIYNIPMKKAQKPTVISMVTTILKVLLPSIYAQLVRNESYVIAQSASNINSPQMAK